MTLDDAPLTLKRIIAEAAKEFKATGECRARIRAVFPDKPYTITNSDVSPMMQPGSKDVIRALMIHAAKMDALAVVLVSETWVLEVSSKTTKEKEEAVKVALEGRVFKHPNRKERLLVSYNEPGVTILAMAKIGRRPRNLYDWEFTVSSAAEYELDCKLHNDLPRGRFDNIFHEARRG